MGFGLICTLKSKPNPLPLSRNFEAVQEPLQPAHCISWLQGFDMENTFFWKQTMTKQDKIFFWSNCYIALIRSISTHPRLWALQHHWGRKRSLHHLQIQVCSWVLKLLEVRKTGLWQFLEVWFTNTIGHHTQQNMILVCSPRFEEESFSVRAPIWMCVAVSPSRDLRWYKQNHPIIHPLYQITEPIYAAWQYYKPCLKRDIFLGWKPPLRHHAHTHPTARNTCNIVSVNFSQSLNITWNFRVKTHGKGLGQACQPDNMSTLDRTPVRAKDATHTSTSSGCALNRKVKASNFKDWSEASPVKSSSRAHDRSTVTKFIVWEVINANSLKTVWTI